MKRSDYEIGEEIELDQINIILKIPKRAARLDLTVHLFDDEGEPMKVHSAFDAESIRDMRQDFLENVEDGDEYDARYVITDEGRKHLESLAHGEME